MASPLSPPSSRLWLPLLRDLVDILNSSMPLSSMLSATLGILAKNLGMMRGAITLIVPATGKIRIQASYGLDAGQQKKGEYMMGEGITGKVIATGEAMCVADVSHEPLFLNRTGSRDLKRDKISFLCVPIRLRGEVVGALSVDGLGQGEKMLEEELLLLQIISGLVAQTAADSMRDTAQEAGARRPPPGFVGSSDAMAHIYEQIGIVAPATTTVLLQGESGTGKELAAKAIHLRSHRAAGPFISLNCAAIPDTLVESELFGHEKGAFTGAAHTRQGRFELANGGTLFLDEIGELAPMAQAKLLRVLQEHAFERLGGMSAIQTDARLIAATNRDLAKMVEAGQFRRDLYYRINVFPILLPPLRERREDIPALATRFLERFARNEGRDAPAISLEAMRLLQEYQWPGNVRELQNVMEAAILFMGQHSTLLPQHLPAHMRPTAAPIRGESPGNLQARLDEVEYAYVVDALARSGGHVNRAAGLLGLTERIMGLRLKKYGLDYKNFRS